MKRLFRHLRLLPTVIVLAGGLLVIKGAGLAMEAHAQSSAAAPAAAKSAPVKPAADPATDDAGTSSVGEVDVLTSLAKRRSMLDARERDLDMRANLIAAAEKRVDAKIAELKQLQLQTQNLMGARDAAEKAQIAALVKTYSSMKPKDAARIFNDLDDNVLLSVAEQMKPDVLGAVLAQMKGDNAEKLTVRLATRLKPKLPPPQPPQQQLAANTTPPAPAPAAAGEPAAQATTAPAPAAPAPAQAQSKPAAAAPAPAAAAK